MFQFLARQSIINVLLVSEVAVSSPHWSLIFAKAAWNALNENAFKTCETCNMEGEEFSAAS